MKTDPIAFIKNRFPTEHVRYMANGGNLGDALIAAATMQSFDRAGIQWKFASQDRGDISGSLLVYGGGGSLIDLYEGGFACIKHLHNRGRNVMILPQTVRGRAEFWQDIPTTIVFCRDVDSYEYMKQFDQHEVYLADDMATNLAVDLPPYSSVVAYRRHLEERGQWGAERVNALRIDDESRGKMASEIDFSNFAYPQMATAEDIISHAVFFLTMIAGAKSIVTDRLHVAVSCGLLGIPCEIEDNSYGKLKGVFENTLAEKFRSISLRGAQ